MFPYPLGAITDNAQAHLLFWNHPGFFDLLEGWRRASVCWRWRRLVRRLSGASPRRPPGAFVVRCWDWGLTELTACHVLDYSHCAQYLHKVATAQDSDAVHALEWVAATLTRLSLGKVGWVLGGLRRMPPTSAEARKASDHCWGYLNDHRSRTHYRT